MVTIGSLWLAILVSAILAWLASALLHTVIPLHKYDFVALPDEEAVSGLVDVPPGRYSFPFMLGPSDLADEGNQAKLKNGPVGVLTILPKGVPTMKRELGLSFVYNIVVGVLVAYIATATLSADASYLAVFRVAGFTAWMAYSWALVPNAIWFGQPWSEIGKYMVDGLVYAGLTGGAFGWLWAA